ncbi:MAG: V-type ATP synthase subunit F [Candidatus Subteraquimicrobiales bacterium]|nr:V-type ATP synthase subunit F [Candidatus Subteraquimicrobiales bacterium]
MYKMAIVGDKTSVLGFKALGLDSYPIFEKGQARNLWLSLLKKDYGAIFLTEEIYEEIKDLLVLVSEEIKPSVLIIPAITGSTGLGLKRIKGIIEKAVGIDILSKG